jgi:predicted MFS family arabinose efflux permease
MPSPHPGAPPADEGAPRPRGALADRVPALRHPNFRRYVAGQSISLVGFWMQVVAQSWLVYRLTHSELVLGAFAFVAYLPMLLVSPAAGVVADRVDKHRLIIATQSASMAVALGLGALVWAGFESVPLVAAAAVGLGTVGAFDLPARQSFLIEMVGPADLASAVAVNATIFNSARVIGPAAAGVLVAQVGEASCFLLNGLSYLATLWAFLGMRFGDRPAVQTVHGRRRELRAGFRYVWGEPAVRALLAGLGIVSAFAIQANVLMPSLASRGFGLGAEGFGSLLTAFGLGAVLSAILLALGTRTREQHRGSILWGLVMFGAGLFVVATSPRIEVALAGQVLAGIGMVRFTVSTNTWVQLLVEDRYRGRVMGIHTVMFAGMAPFGSLILGAIAEPLGPQRALALSGTVTIATAVVLARGLGRGG